jgi:hypothetical protein
VLRVARPTLIVPRVRPRQEQLVRAERFAALGLIDMLHPDDLSPAALGAWMARSGRAATPRQLDTGGLDRFADLAAAALGHVPPSSRRGLIRRLIRFAFSSGDCHDPVRTAPHPRIGYVLKRYPRFSETFVVNEILAHEAAGQEIEIFALRPVQETHFQDAISRVRAPVTHVPTATARPTRSGRSLRGPRRRFRGRRRGPWRREGRPTT